MSTSTTTIITLDDLHNVDVNHLFNFNLAYDFEVLKLTVQSLIRNQFVMTERLLLLENANVDKEFKIQKAEIITDTMNEEITEITNHLGKKDDDFKSLHERKKKELEEKENNRISKINIPKTIIYITSSKSVNNNNNSNIINLNNNYNNDNNNSRNNLNNMSNNITILEEKSKTIDGKSKDINILSNNIKDNDDNDSWIVNVTEPVDLSVIFLYYLEKDFSNGQRN